MDEALEELRSHLALVAGKQVDVSVTMLQRLLLAAKVESGALQVRALACWGGAVGGRVARACLGESALAAADLDAPSLLLRRRPTCSGAAR